MSKEKIIQCFNTYNELKNEMKTFQKLAEQLEYVFELLEESKSEWTLEDQRKLELISRNWDELKMEDLEKICKL